MLLILDHHSGVPTYRQLMDQIKFQIASGILPANAELPSTRALCAELSVNQMTVSKAYNLLEREGVLERRPGQTLVVRSFGENGLTVKKLDQFRQILAPAVSAARQLGIDAPQALNTFREMLKNPASHSIREPSPTFPKSNQTIRQAHRVAVD